MKYFVLSIIVLLLPSVLVVAQPVPPPQPDIVPITGIEYLLLGGGAYGVYRLKKRRNNKKEA